MTIDQIILFTLFTIFFGMLLWGRFRYDVVAFTALMVGVVLGAVPTDAAFSGFGHPATLVVALVLIVSAGLVRSGAVFPHYPHAGRCVAQLGCTYRPDGGDRRRAFGIHEQRRGLGAFDAG